MDHDDLFERLWTGAASLPDWSAAVAGGGTKTVSDDVIAIHTGYLFGNATAIRTGGGLVLVDTGSRETANATLAALRRWDDERVYTVIYTRGHIDHTWGARLLDQEADTRVTKRPHIIAHRNVLDRFASIVSKAASMKAIRCPTSRARTAEMLSERFLRSRRNFRLRIHAKRV
jgi:glyoxylase-like metal-dependent hydrolase (beta-lactamase superfamily II)